MYGVVNIGFGAKAEREVIVARLARALDSRLFEMGRDGQALGVIYCFCAKCFVVSAGQQSRFLDVREM
jgi:hypothetical protein